MGESEDDITVDSDNDHFTFTLSSTRGRSHTEMRRRFSHALRRYRCDALAFLGGIGQLPGP